MQFFRVFFRIESLVFALLLLTGCSRDAQYYLDKGIRSAAAGKDPDAILNFEKALQKNPQSGPTYLQLGLAYRRQPNLRKAYDAMQQAVELLPDSYEAKVVLADLSLSIYLADSTRPRIFYDRLNSAADQLLARDAQSFDGLRLKGDLALLDQKPDQASEWLRKANQVKPMQSNVVLPLVESLFGNNQPAEAEKVALEFIGREKTNSAAYDALYLFYATHNRIPDAEKILQLKIENNLNNPGPRLQLAEHYVHLKKQPEALRTLQRMLDNPRAFPEGRLQVGDFYSSMGNVDEAVKQYQAGLNTSSDKTTYQKRLIEILTRQGKRDEAAQMVEAALREHPADEELKTSKAVLLVDSGKPENVAAALPIFQELVKAKPVDAARHLNLGRTELLSGDTDRAQTELAAALQLNPASIPVRALLADIVLKKRDYTAALRYSDEILKVQPRNRAARLVRTASLLGLGRYEELQQELDKVLAAQPKSADAQFQSGSLDLAEGRVRDAEDAFRRTWEAKPGSVQALEGIVEAEIAQKQPDKALRLINQEIARAPDSAALRGLLAATALRTGNPDIAIEQYRRLISEKPQAGVLYFGLGEALRAKGEYSGALAQFDKASRIEPGNPGFVVAVAGAESLMGRKAEARDSFRKALAMQPDNATIMNNLAYLIEETGGSLEEARKLAQTAVQKQPHQPGFMDTLGWIYQKTGQTDSAIQVFDNLTRQQPKNPLYQYHLAVSLVQKGDRARARETLTAALVLKPDNNLNSDIRQLLAKVN